ncbi:MAG: hypothetical protein R2764_07225 [Bacteroidales bacterium]
MKTTIKLFMLFLTFSVIFLGCQKSEVIDQSEKDNNDNTFISKSTKTPCGTPTVATLLDWNNSIFPGTVTVINDENNLFVTFETNSDYEMWKTSLYVGAAENIPLNSSNGYIDPETHTGHFDRVCSLYQGIHMPRIQDTTFTIHLSGLDNCFAVVAISIVRSKITGELSTVSAMIPTKTTSYYFDYCVQDCSEPECETAFAYGEDVATCFIDIPGVNSNRWGWSNGPITDPSSYSWEIYAGAGQCEIGKGTLVGTLDVDYSGGMVNVVYNIDPNFTLNETHLFIGDDYLPKKGNKYKTAPGQYPYSGESSYSIPATGPIYIVAHSVVCGYYEK